MIQTWRISSFNGALLACYFIPTWGIGAFRIIMSPIQGLYERSNISLVLFLSDYLQLPTMSTVRAGWFLALGKLTVVAFFAIFLVFTTRASIRKSGGCDEALSLALGIGSLISFITMIMAAKMGQAAAVQLHAAELLLLLGTAVLVAVEPPEFRQVADEAHDATPSARANYSFNRSSS